MKILLINPPRFNGIPVGREDRCENTIPNILPPMGLVYLAGILSRCHSVSLIDANAYDLTFTALKQKINEEKPNAIVFRSTPETFFSDIKTADVAKEVCTSIKTIMICWSLISLPQSVMAASKNVDFYIIDHFFERPIEMIVDNIPPSLIASIAYRENGIIKINFEDNHYYDFNSLPMPAWHLIPDFRKYWVQIRSFSPYAMIESMRGCGLGCKFCTIAHVKPIFRNINQVVDEIEYLFHDRGVKYFGFFDATFNISRSRVFDLCEEILQRNLNNLVWFANIRADKMDICQAYIMKKAGCRGVSVGIESGSQQILDLNNKRIKINDAIRTINTLKKVGIHQYASFIVGLPGETHETINETINLILQTKPTGFQINSLVPYPKSQLYEEAVKQGKFSTFKFDRLLLYDTPISLCDLSVNEINYYRRTIYRKIYHSPLWWSSNCLTLIRNPSELKFGINYGLKVLRRTIYGIDNET